MILSLFKSCALTLMLVVLPSAARGQDSVSQTCAQLGFKPGTKGHTDCVNQNSGGGKAAPKPANPAPAAKAPLVPELTAAQREDKFWDGAMAAGNKEGFDAYLESYPSGRFVSMAKANLASLVAAVAQREDKFWDDAKALGNKEAYQGYLNSYPAGRYVDLAKGNITRLEVASRPPIVQSAAKLANSSPGMVFKDCPDCPEMVLIPAGSFEMGGTASDAQPVHRVTLRSFSIGKTEVTQGQWRAIMGSNPSHFGKCGDDCPVERVSWDNAKQFVSQLSAKTGKTYRLPTEAEWEYACRAGGREEYCGSNSVEDVGWYSANGLLTHSVAGKKANAWGLYDMSGNVWEWTEDCLNANYSGAPTDGSAWMTGNCSQRVVRGGSWYLDPQDLRSAIRSRNSSAYRFYGLGFRVARTD